MADHHSLIYRLALQLDTASIDLFIERLGDLSNAGNISADIAAQFKNMSEAQQDVVMSILNRSEGFADLANNLQTAADNVKTISKDNFAGLLENEELRTQLGEETTSILDQIALTEELFGAREELNVQDEHRLASMVQGVLVQHGMNDTLATTTAREIATAAATEGLAAAETTATATTLTLGEALKLAFSSNPVGFILTILSTIASIAIPIFNHFYKSAEELIAAGKEASAELDKIRETLEKQVDTVDELGSKYAKLAQGINQVTGANKTLSTSEYKEFVELSNKVAEALPDLVVGYTEEGDAILKLAGSYEAINAQLQEYLDTQKAISASEARSKLEDIVGGDIAEAKTEHNEAGKLLATYKSYMDTYRIWKEYILSGTSIANIATPTEQTNVDEILRKSGARELINNGADKSLIQDRIESYLLSLEKDANAAKAKILDVYSEMNQGIIDSLQDDEIYAAFSDSQRSVFQRVLGNYDWYDMGLKKKDSVWAYVQNDILPLIQSKGPAISKALDMQVLFNKNKVSVGKFSAEIDSLLSSLEGVADEQTLTTIRDMFSIPIGDLSAIARKVYAALGGFASGTTLGRMEEFFGALVGNELNAFLDWMNEVELSGYETWSAMLEAFEIYKNEVLSLTKEDVLTQFFSGTSETIEGVNSKISSLADSYSKLQKGELALPDVMSLVSEYPELIKYVDLADEGFGRLDEGLISLLRNSPKVLIDELKELKETNKLTEDAAKAVDEFIDELEDMPADAIEDISAEFGIVANSIRKARGELTQLEADLEEPDYDYEYNILQDKYARLTELYNAKQTNSREFKLIAAALSPDLLSMNYKEQGTWIAENAKLWGENANVTQELLSRIASMDGPGQALDGLASYENGIFTYDVSKIDDIALALGLTTTAFQALLGEMQMYNDIAPTTTAYFSELSQAGKFVDANGKIVASLSSLMDYLKMSEKDVRNVIASINALYGLDIQIYDTTALSEWEGWSSTFFDSWQGWANADQKELAAVTSMFEQLGVSSEQFRAMFEENDFEKVLEPLLTGLGWAQEDIDALYEKLSTPVAIDFRGVDEFSVDKVKELFADHDIEIGFNTEGALQVTQDVVDQMLALLMTAVEVEAVLDDLSKVEGITIDTNLNIDGKIYNPAEILPEESSGQDDTSVITFDADIEPYMGGSGAVDNDRKRQEEDPANISFEANTAQVTAEAEHYKSVLESLPPTLSTHLEFTLGTVPNFAEQTKNNLEHAPTLTEFLSGIRLHAKGTGHAHEGLSLLGDEYSPTGTPKPELVVSDGYAYLAGVNGPTIGYLHEGDQVYTASETKKILGRTAPREFDAIPAFGGGTIKGYSSKKDFVEDVIAGRQLNSAYIAAIYEVARDLSIDYTGEMELNGVSGEAIAEDIEELLKDELEKLREELDSAIADIEHKIFIGEKNGSLEQASIIAYHKQIQESIHALANKFREMGLSEESDYIQDLQKLWWEHQDTIIEIQNEKYDEQHEALNTIYELAQNYVKWESEQTIEALEEQKDTYSEIIDRKKEIIELTRKERDHEDSLSEKLEEIGELQNRIDLLKLDDSREAVAERSQLEKDLQVLQKELADEQWDYAADAQTEALDKELDAYEKNIDKHIEDEENKLSSTQKLHDETIAYIEQNWSTLFDTLNAWNYEHGQTLTTELETAWQKGVIAAQEYGNFVSALNLTNPDRREEGTLLSIADPAITAIIQQMKANSELWLTDVENRDLYQNENIAKAAEISILIGQNAYKDSNGIWWVGNEKLYDYNEMSIEGTLDENVSAPNTENLLSIDPESEIGKSLLAYSQGGSVDLLKRPLVDAAKLIAAGYDDAGEGLATVFTSTFSDETGTIALNFTPIITDEHGNVVGILSPDELQAYAESVISGAEDVNSLQIGAQFIGVDAISQAVLAAETIHSLHEEYLAQLKPSVSNRIEPDLEIHHDGGVAGNVPTLKQDEVLSILKKGEPVLDKKSEFGLYKLIDFAQLMAERLSAPLDFSWMSDVISGFDRVAQSTIRSSVSNSTSSDFAPHVEVNISHSGSFDEQEAKKYGNIAADAALAKLKDSFTKRGINNFSAALLKP